METTGPEGNRSFLFQYMYALMILTCAWPFVTCKQNTKTKNKKAKQNKKQKQTNKTQNPKNKEIQILKETYLGNGDYLALGYFDLWTV